MAQRVKKKEKKTNFQTLTDVDSRKQQCGENNLSEFISFSAAFNKSKTADGVLLSCCLVLLEFFFTFLKAVGHVRQGSKFIHKTLKRR